MSYFSFDRFVNLRLSCVFKYDLISARVLEKDMRLQFRLQMNRGFKEIHFFIEFLFIFDTLKLLPFRINKFVRAI